MSLYQDMDFATLFKFEQLTQLSVANYSLYEIGLKKFLAVCSDTELQFLFINTELQKFEKNYFWDFVDNPIYCMCFEPSGTWVVIISEQKVLLVPFLPLFSPESTFDCKWSLSGVTVLPLVNVPRPCSVLWWLTKESENILIIGSKQGTISFFSLETQSVIAECKVSDEIDDLQICFDDSLDLLTLLITGLKSQQWKLVLEHRSFGYNLLQQLRNQSDNKKDSFMSYIKQFSKDKITIFSQGSSKEDNSRPQTVEYLLKPAEYCPAFRKKSHNWALTAQYVNGQHFLTAFDVCKGHIFIESPDQDAASRQLQPSINKDVTYSQGLFSDRLLYLLTKNSLEVHSTAFSTTNETKNSREQSLMWSTELPGAFRQAFLMSSKEPAAPSTGWKQPTFLCDLQLPRFSLEPCLIVTTTGVYMFSTVTEPCEWLVGGIMRGGGGAERAASALAAPLPALLLAAADMLLARGKLAPAHCLYTLSQCHPNGWLARLGVFGRLQELSMYKQPAGTEGMLSKTVVTIKLYAILLKVANNKEEKFDNETKFSCLSSVELEDLTAIASSLGLWDLVPIFNIYRGHPSLLVSGMRHKSTLCRGALDCLLRQRSVVTMLLNPSAGNENKQWLLDFIDENYLKFDSKILKCLCLWLCPLQEQFRPVMRDMKDGITTTYTPQMSQLISTFMRVVSALERYSTCPDIILPSINDTWKQSFVPRRHVSAGYAHWAVCDDGNAKIMVANSEVDINLIGRVFSVSCGRHHTLVLTENGLYTSGDNSFGQLGMGSAWGGATGDGADASGTLTLVPYDWSSPVTVIAAGHYHSAAVDMGGRLYMWGWGVHGQLGLGTIDDEWSPKLVTKLQGRKVIDVCCGSCHTVALTIDGSVFTFGASVFGQLGSGSREKSAVPRKVALPAPAKAIASNYFHTLALLSSGVVYTWGASPQAVRAASARRAADPAPPPPASAAAAAAAAAATDDGHLTPTAVPLDNVRGTIVQIATGWHHSCILNNAGTLYTWGLNFDGQLGSGDRKLVVVPTEARFNFEIPTETEAESEKKFHDQIQDIDLEIANTKALVACGGDFTVYIDDDGKIYISGNTHQDGCSKDPSKLTNRVIMMKTTKRVIKIPASLHNNKFVFKPIDRLDIMFPFLIDTQDRNTIEPKSNPLNILTDFRRTSWADEIITSLLPWIRDDSVQCNKNMAAKLAYHTKRYDDCLNLLLQNLLIEKPKDVFYTAHTDTDVSKELSSSKKDEYKIAITSAMSERIKEVSLSILNEQPFPLLDPNLCKSIPCSCDETLYLPLTSAQMDDETKTMDLSIRAANVVDKCVGMFPVEPTLWETCFRISKDFYLDNNLRVEELEKVLRKYMELNARTMAAAIMYSNDCVQYSKILSPKLYLNMCSQIMDAWN